MGLIIFMNRSFQTNGQLNPQHPIPSSLSEHSFDHNLPCITYNNQAASTLKIVRVDTCADSPECHVISVKPEQLLAGLVFRLFGLERLPSNTVNRNVICLANYLDQHAIELDFNGYTNKIKQVVQLVNNFHSLNGREEKSETYRNSVAEYKSDLTTFAEDSDVISFSKVIGKREIAIIYNTSETDAKERFILMHTNMGEQVIKISPIYGYDNCSYVHLFHGIINDKSFSYIKIYLKPMQLIVLKNY